MPEHYSFIFHIWYYGFNSVGVSIADKSARAKEISGKNSPTHSVIQKALHVSGCLQCLPRWIWILFLHGPVVINSPIVPTSSPNSWSRLLNGFPVLWSCSLPVHPPHYSQDESSSKSNLHLSSSLESFVPPTDSWQIVAPACFSSPALLASSAWRPFRYPVDCRYD